MQSKLHQRSKVAAVRAAARFLIDTSIEKPRALPLGTCDFRDRPIATIFVFAEAAGRLPTFEPFFRRV